MDVHVLVNMFWELRNDHVRRIFHYASMYTDLYQIETHQYLAGPFALSAEEIFNIHDLQSRLHAL